MKSSEFAILLNGAHGKRMWKCVSFEGEGHRIGLRDEESVENVCAFVTSETVMNPVKKIAPNVSPVPSKVPG